MKRFETDKVKKKGIVENKKRAALVAGIIFFLGGRERYGQHIGVSLAG